MQEKNEAQSLLEELQSSKQKLESQVRDAFSGEVASSHQAIYVREVELS